MPGGDQSSGRAGRFVTQPKGDYRAFLPAPLPPEPPVELGEGLVRALSEAQIELGRLDGAVKTIPDPDFFISMYVRREAVLSSQIEGTQSTLEDLLEVELDSRRQGARSDVGEIVNYVQAMNHGLARLDDLPLSLRLIREIHAELLRDGRGAQKTPGEFRRSQNWIGPGGAGLGAATFVPPPPDEMKDALGDLERFLHTAERPALVDIGLIHAQFETIHPFLDGNGRVGRLLITLLLIHRGVLRGPLLYLSLYLKQNRSEYYERLTAIRERGDWEGWLLFFLTGIAETAREATGKAESIFDLRERHRQEVIKGRAGPKGLALLSGLYQQPLINVNRASSMVGVTYETANRLVGHFEDLGILREVTGLKRRRVFRYDPYLALFE